jgi:hypothetical protein
MNFVHGLMSKKLRKVITKVVISNHKKRYAFDMFLVLL